jgi:hypothetical protein
MARFCYLMLHNGEWDGKEIVSPEWAARSTEAHYQTSSGMDYGYQWWVMEGGAFGARGHYEQNLYVFPQADIVVVFTGNIPDDVIPSTNGLLYRYILGACTDLPSEATHKMYDEHGLTFEYPIGFSRLESQLPETGKLDASSGLLQFRLDSYPFELVQISWNEAEPGMDPAAYLEGQLGSIPQQAGGEYVFGKSRTLTRDQHEVIHQYFDFESGGIQLRGVINVWYCEESGRVILFSFVTNPDVSDQDLEALYQGHLDAFSCHETEEV